MKGLGRNTNHLLVLDPSIFRARPSSDRAKIYVISGRKILPMTIPLDASGLNFRVGPGLGRAARAFYSVKQLKTVFRTGLGP
jgi:hypothetical protein